MNALRRAIVLSIALSVPAVAFAQAPCALTRAQVRTQLVELEHAGYHLWDGDAEDYPDRIQAAEARLAAQKAKQKAEGHVAVSSQPGSCAAG